MVLNYGPDSTRQLKADPFVNQSDLRKRSSALVDFVTYFTNSDTEPVGELWGSYQAVDRASRLNRDHCSELDSQRDPSMDFGKSASEVADRICKTVVIGPSISRE